MVFFVLSGFLVGGLSLNKSFKKPVSISEYMAHRFARIYVVFIPALILTASLDLGGMFLFPGSPFYYDLNQAQSGFLPRIEPNGLTITTFIGNSLMLFGILVPKFGSNGPVWSLVNEWWYYCLFACFLGFVVHKSMLSRAICIVLICIIYAILPSATIILGSVWIFGILAFLYLRSGKRAPSIIVSLTCFVASLLLARALRHGAEVDPNGLDWRSLGLDILVGASFAVVITSIGYHRKAGLPFSNIHRSFADGSYSLYLSHYPVVVFVAALSHAEFGMPTLGSVNIKSMSVYIISVFASVAISTAMYIAFESKTKTFRDFLSKAFIIRPSKSATRS